MFTFFVVSENPKGWSECEENISFWLHYGLKRKPYVASTKREWKYKETVWGEKAFIGYNDREQKKIGFGEIFTRGDKTDSDWTWMYWSDLLNLKTINIFIYKPCVCVLMKLNYKLLT